MNGFPSHRTVVVEYEMVNVQIHTKKGITEDIKDLVAEVANVFHPVKSKTSVLSEVCRIDAVMNAAEDPLLKAIQINTILTPLERMKRSGRILDFGMRIWDEDQIEHECGTRLMYERTQR